MERQDILAGAALFLFCGFLGFYIGFSLQEGKTGQSYISSMNVTADDDNEIATANFDGKKIDLMYSDSMEVSYYLDTDRDGSFDREINNVTRDGKVHETSEIVTLNSTSYRLSFRYRASDPGWFRLYLVRELQ